MKDMIGKIITFCFLGAVGVLILTKAQGFSTAVGTVVQPLEYETSFIGTAGGSSANVGKSYGTSKTFPN